MSRYPVHIATSISCKYTITLYTFELSNQQHTVILIYINMFALYQYIEIYHQLQDFASKPVLFTHKQMFIFTFFAHLLEKKGNNKMIQTNF